MGKMGEGIGREQEEGKGEMDREMSRCVGGQRRTEREEEKKQRPVGVSARRKRESVACL